MKQMKKFLSMLLALVMVLSMLPVSAFAAEQPVITVGSVAGKPGEEVTVNVDITENPGFWMAQWTVSYDTTRLEKVEFTKAVTDGFVWTNEGNNYVFENAANEDMTYTGTILNLKFKIKEDAPLGDAEVTIIDLEACDYDVEDVFFTINAGKVTVEAQPVTGISLDQTELTLDQGATATLTATVEPADAGDKTVTWTSSNESVATVTNGLVTAVGAGSATITAKAGDFEATCAVTVAGANVPVTDITLDKSAFYNGTYVMEGNSATLIANVIPDYATDKTVTWSSSDESVATVDANGVVNALKAGSVTITAASGEVTATCAITVIDNPFTMTADGETVALQYTGSGTTIPSSLCYYTVEVPTGTKIVKLTGPMTTDWSMSQTLKDNLADGAITLDLSTLSRSGDHWEISMVAKNGYYWGACHVISIYMTPCEGDHTFTDATCTAPKTCTVCYTTEGEALGHDLVETTAQVDAVCETPGTTAVMDCTRCDYTEGGTEIPAPGHAWREVMVTKQPTCDEEGETLYTCTTCPEGNAATKTEPIAALGHTWNEGEVTTQPTCTEKGVKSFICLVDGCGGTKTEEVPANGHNYVDGYCSVCEKMEPVTIPFTKADGSAIHSKFTGIEGLVVDGIRISHWSEWKQGSNYQTQSITIYVDPADKDVATTLTLALKEGQTGSGALIGKTATVQLSNGVGSYSASRMTIGTGGLAPRLNLNITFALGYCTGEHEWTDATCETPKTCSVCGKTEGEALGHDWNAESVCQREGCGASNKITEIELSHPNLKSEAMTMTTGTNEKITVSFNAVDNKVGATQVVAWFSSDETVATVADGVVTALKAGTTTITAKAVDANGIALLADGEEVLAQFTLTVADPAPGYTVTMGADVENAVIGSTVNVPVTIGNTGDVTTYNAFDLTFEYDPTILELTSTEISGMTVTAENGQIHVERYGTDLTVGAPALTLTFNAIATGNSNVKVTSAKVDIAEAALTQDAPDASVIDDLTQVSVSGYTVTLPEEFKGESSVLPGEDYTFTAKDKNYNYTVTAKIGEDEITVTDNGDGTFTIAAKDITGNLVITTEKSAKEFTVTLGEDMTGETKATYMTDYTATLTKDAAYNYNVEVTIGNVKYTGFSYDLNTGLITIPGEAITGAIAFNTNKTAKTQDQHSVTIGGNSGDVTGATEVTNGEDYTFTIAKEVGYTYAVSATMNGEAVEVIDNGDGTYTIKGVTGDLEITVTKTYDMEVEVNQYVGLDGKVMFLVTAKASVDTGKALAYAENAMYYSEVYGAWSWLVITDGTLTVEDAKAQITLVEAETVTLTATKDVNESTKVDINDAQLVFDMYNNEYQTFETATMQKFLKADVTGDKAINVNDAAAIVADIIAAK